MNGTGGYIKSPPLESIREDAIDFSWRILVPRGNVINLLITEYSEGLTVFYKTFQF